MLFHPDFCYTKNMNYLSEDEVKPYVIRAHEWNTVAAALERMHPDRDWKEGQRLASVNPWNHMSEHPLEHAGKNGRADASIVLLLGVDDTRIRTSRRDTKREKMCYTWYYSDQVESGDRDRLVLVEPYRTKPVKTVLSVMEF